MAALKIPRKGWPRGPQGFLLFMLLLHDGLPLEVYKEYLILHGPREQLEHLLMGIAWGWRRKRVRPEIVDCMPKSP